MRPQLQAMSGGGCGSKESDNLSLIPGPFGWLISCLNDANKHEQEHFHTLGWNLPLVGNRDGAAGSHSTRWPLFAFGRGQRSFVC